MSATGLVSQKKKRLQQDNFDLDASFINCSPDLDCRLLAMAYPSEGREGRDSFIQGLSDPPLVAAASAKPASGNSS